MAAVPVDGLNAGAEFLCFRRAVGQVGESVEGDGGGCTTAEGQKGEEGQDERAAAA